LIRISIKSNDFSFKNHCKYRAKIKKKAAFQVVEEKIFFVETPFLFKSGYLGKFQRKILKFSNFSIFENNA